MGTNGSSQRGSQGQRERTGKVSRGQGNKFSAAALTPFRSVGLKLFLIIFAGFLVCVVTLGVFSVNQSGIIIRQKVADSNMATAQQAAARIDQLLSNYEQRSMEMISNQVFVTNLNLAFSTSATDYDRYTAQREIETLFNALRLSDDNVVGLYVVPGDDESPMIAAVSGTKPARSTLWDWPFVQQVLELSGRVMWVPTMPNGLTKSLDRPTIAIVRSVSVFVSKPAFLAIEIYADVLESPLQGVSFGEDSVSQLIAPGESGNVVVYSTEPSEVATTYTYEMPDAGSSATMNIDGTEMLSVAGEVPLNGWRLVSNIPVSELVKDVSTIRNVTVLICVAAILIAAAIGFWVVIMVGRPLGMLRRLMNEGEKGNLTVRSKIRQRDEIGQVADSFNRMMDQITELVRQTNRIADDVLDTASELTEASRKTAASAREIAIATEEIAKGATNLATESERGTEMTAHIGRQVQAVIQENEEMGRAASIVEDSGRRGTEYMEELLTKTARTEEMTRSMTAKVERLKESTGSIRQILEVLNNITKQTNILSLNATIEAARAGEAGKGFAVVADEIRKLADQSRQSIGVVGEIVENIQREIEETVGVMAEANPLFQEQIASVREASEIFADVRARMNDFVQRLDLATKTVGRLEEAQSALNLAMTNVSAVAEESSATSEEVASLSHEQQNVSEELVRLSGRLETASQGLRDSLSRFTVN